MKAKSRIVFPALAALAVIAIAVVLSRRPSSTSAQTTSQPPEAPQPTAPVTVMPNGPHVVMDTSMGRISCQFFQKQAPIAVANFIGLATGTKDWTNPTTHQVEHHKPLYDGTIFHRVIPEFMIQGGDPAGSGYGGPGYKFGLEVDPNLNFDVPGRLAMANTGEPNSNGSQFFITEGPYPTLDQNYTIFGQCDDPSVNVVKTIARVPRDGNDRPLSPVVLKKVTIVPVGQPLPPLPAWEQPAAQPPAAPASQQ
ncbi:MAG TPA: peptidylprolyl isomerase [Terracidiphilus sp.]|nr:peptidylprolyl isomerase [Terracidiphilus sp.]